MAGFFAMLLPERSNFGLNELLGLKRLTRHRFWQLPDLK